jgi:hypothetical protein
MDFVWSRKLEDVVFSSKQDNVGLDLFDLKTTKRSTCKENFGEGKAVLL